jgi:hypothetical protein
MFALLVLAAADFLVVLDGLIVSVALRRSSATSGSARPACSGS